MPGLAHRRGIGTRSLKLKTCDTRTSARKQAAEAGSLRRSVHEIGRFVPRECAALDAVKRFAFRIMQQLPAKSQHHCRRDTTRNRGPLATAYSKLVDKIAGQNRTGSCTGRAGR